MAMKRRRSESRRSGHPSGFNPPGVVCSLLPDRSRATLARACCQRFACKLGVGDREDRSGYSNRHLLVHHVGWKVPFVGCLVYRQHVARDW